MRNLCIGMKVVNITQVSQGDYSHPNYALDLGGSDAGIDFYFAMGAWKCVGKWRRGYNTFFFIPVDSNGKAIPVHCADGVDRYVTLALTHSNMRYIKTKVGTVYQNGVAMYEEGTKGNATGNHIHLEIAQGYQTSKYYDSKLKAYRMRNELDPAKVFFIDRSFSTVKSLHGLTMKYCDAVEETEEMLIKAKSMKLNVRKSPVIGTVLRTIPVGGTAKIVATPDKFQSDKYQWVEVVYDGIQGYCQLDSKVYTIVKE